MRVLALQLKRIGDLALTTPALHALKTAGHHVTLVISAGTDTLLPMLRDSVDDALIYRGQNSSAIAFWRKMWRGHFDACVDFTGRDRSALMTVASHAAQRITADSLLRGGGWRRWCYNVVAEAPVRSRHTVDHYLDYLVPFDLQPASQEVPVRPVLHLPEGAVERAAVLLASHGIAATDDFIVIHPGSARPEKYWVPERWAEVIACCQEELGRRCVLTGGQHDPYEQAHHAAIKHALAAQRQTCVDLAGQLDLPALAAVLARAGLVVGVDSGPMHLAVAWSRPQIVLFGPTNPFHWRPRHDGGVVLRAGHGDTALREFFERSPGAPLDQISTQAVINCIKQMPCPPVPVDEASVSPPC